MRRGESHYLFILTYLAYGDDYADETVPRAKSYEKTITTAKGFLEDAKDHRFRAKIEKLLATVYSVRRDYVQAEDHYERALAEYEQIGEKSIDDEVFQLAVLYSYAGNARIRDQRDKARRLYKTVMQAKSQHVPSDHPRCVDLVMLQRNATAGYLELAKHDLVLLREMGTLYRYPDLEEIRQDCIARAIGIDDPVDSDEVEELLRSDSLAVLAPGAEVIPERETAPPSETAPGGVPEPGQTAPQRAIWLLIGIVLGAIALLLSIRHLIRRLWSGEG